MTSPAATSSVARGKRLHAAESACRSSRIDKERRSGIASLFALRTRAVRPMTTPLPPADKPSGRGMPCVRPDSSGTATHSNSGRQRLLGVAGVVEVVRVDDDRRDRLARWRSPSSMSKAAGPKRGLHSQVQPSLPSMIACDRVLLAVDRDDEDVLAGLLAGGLDARRWRRAPFRRCARR